MKPSLTIIENSNRHAVDARQVRKTGAFLKTDYSYSGVGTFDGLHGRRARNVANIRSFRKLSDNYFEHEAPHTFIGEAALFGVMVIAVVLPMLNGASALSHFLHAIGAF